MGLASAGSKRPREEWAGPGRGGTSPGTCFPSWSKRHAAPVSRVTAAAADAIAAAYVRRRTAGSSAGVNHLDAAA